MASVPLNLTPLTEDLHQDIRSLHRNWKRTPPPEMPDHSVVLTTPDGDVVASVYLYVAGPYLLAEFYVTNPRFSPRVRHLATNLGVQGVRAVAASRGLTVFATARTRGIEQTLMRARFRDTRATVWALPPTPIQVWVPPPETESPPEDVAPGGEVTVTETRAHTSAGRRSRPATKRPTPPTVRARKKTVKVAKKVSGRRKKRDGQG